MYVTGEHFVVVKTVSPRLESIKGSQIVLLVQNTHWVPIKDEGFK